MATVSRHQASLLPVPPPAGLKARKVRGAKRFSKPLPKIDRSGPLPEWVKAAPIALKSDSSVDDAIAVVTLACLKHWQTNLPAALDGRDPEGIHQVRVALRRLRSTLSVFKKFIPSTQRAWLRDEVKWLLTQLGAVRDLDVMIHELAAPVAKKVSDDASLAELMRTARRARTRAHSAAFKALQGPRAGRLMARLDAWRAGRGWREGDADDARTVNAEEFARKSLNKRLNKIYAEYGDVEKLSTDERHELRIAVKKMRYGVEFFSAVLPTHRAKRLSNALKHLQDNLGHLNDLDVADRTVAALMNNAEPGAARRHISAGGKAVSHWHDDAAKKAEPEMLKLWRKLKKLPSL